MARPPRTLLELAVANVGPVQAPRVIAFVLLWAAARDSMPEEPSVEEFAKWAAMSRRTAFDRQALFRRAYPGEETPGRLLDVAAAQWDLRRGGQSLAKLPAHLVAA